MLLRIAESDVWKHSKLYSLVISKKKTPYCGSQFVNLSQWYTVSNPQLTVSANGSHEVKIVYMPIYTTSAACNNGYGLVILWHGETFRWGGRLLKYPPCSEVPCCLMWCSDVVRWSHQAALLYSCACKARLGTVPYSLRRYKACSHALQWYFSNLLVNSNLCWSCTYSAVLYAHLWPFPTNWAIL